jgi:hypothetical protein
MKVLARLVKKHNDHTGRSEYALVSKKSGRVLKWFGVQKPSHDRVMKEERRVQYFKHLGGNAEKTKSIEEPINIQDPQNAEDLGVIDERFGEIPRYKWDATPHTPYTQQYPHGFPLGDTYYEMGMGSLESYPTVAAVLGAPLPRETKPEQWTRTFDKINSVRPGKRLGVEFKTYVAFHRKEFPKGKIISVKDIVKALDISPEEIKEGLTEAIGYLMSRKVMKKFSELGNYRLL